ncbi:hypothetical protein R84B8_02498 [Treponema sp. R8-4-B8]
MGKTAIYLHPYDDANLCNRIAEKINATKIYIHAKKALIDFESYNIIGLGVGIDTTKRYQQLLKFVENLPNVQNKKAFIFLTTGLTSEKRMEKDYEKILNLLKNKGFEIINDFNQKGFNTTSILKCISEMNNEIN